MVLLKLYVFKPVKENLSYEKQPNLTLSFCLISLFVVFSRVVRSSVLACVTLTAGYQQCHLTLSLEYLIFNKAQ